MRTRTRPAGRAPEFPCRISVLLPSRAIRSAGQVNDSTPGGDCKHPSAKIGERPIRGRSLPGWGRDLHAAAETPAPAGGAAPTAGRNCHAPPRVLRLPAPRAPTDTAPVDRAPRGTDAEN